MPSGCVPCPANCRELKAIPTLSGYLNVTLNVSQQLPKSRTLRPPVPNAHTGGWPMIQLATSSVWMFCSVMMSPDSTLSSPQARKRLSGFVLASLA